MKTADYYAEKATLAIGHGAVAEAQVWASLAVAAATQAVTDPSLRRMVDLGPL